jgi:lipoyl(octanoyl) transferase
MNVIYLGKTKYPEALQLQEKIFQLRIKKNAADTLLIVEHPPVITLGIRGKISNVLASRDDLNKMKVSIHQINRGGDITYHGPGQIVGYPIFDLKESHISVKEFVNKIENALIDLLKKEFEIFAKSGGKDYTGVWVGDEKIAAIGIAVQHGITMHGFAFNVNTNLAHFQWINPCGISDKGVTSLEKILGKKQDFEGLEKMVAAYFCKTFCVEQNVADKKLFYEQSIGAVN